MEQYRVKRRNKVTGDEWVGGTVWVTPPSEMVVELDGMIPTIEHSVVLAEAWDDEV